MLQVLENSAVRLVVEQAPPGVVYWGALALVVSVTAAVAAFRFRRWGLGSLFVLLSLGFMILLQPGVAWRMEVNRQERVVSWSGIRSGKVVSYEVVRANDISAADMEFNRNARTIVLLGNNGTQYYPLGRQHFSREPEQYVVLTAIRDLIAQGSNAVNRKHQPQ